MRSRREKFHEALANCDNPDHGTYYPYSREELDFIQRSEIERIKHGPFVHLDRATESIIRRNDPATRGPYSEEEMRIASRLANAIYDAEFDWGPDLILKMFFDLDRLFFGGYLIGKVSAEWAQGDQVGPSDFSNCAYLGITEDQEYSRSGLVRVLLNADAIILCENSKQPFRQAWSTMLHELVHAYTVVRCGPASLGNVGGDHDEYFRTMIHAIHRHSWYCFHLKVIDDDEERYKHHHFMSEYWTQGNRGVYGNKVTRRHHSSDTGRSTDYEESDADDSSTQDAYYCPRHGGRGSSRSESRGYGSRGEESRGRYGERYGGQAGYGHGYY